MHLCQTAEIKETETYAFLALLSKFSFICFVFTALVCMVQVTK